MDTRIFNRANGYWPNMPLAANARKAWEHLLGRLDADAVLGALDDYAAEGHTRPPVAGQLAARINPPTKPGETVGETEIQRVRRQKAKATLDVKAGRISQKSFDWYQEKYWGPVERAAEDAA